MLSRFWKKVKKGRGCWEWTASTAGGYGNFFLDGRSPSNDLSNPCENYTSMNECKQKGCHEPATWLVHWPGGSIPSCNKHKAQIQAIGEAMSYGIAAEKIRPHSQCAICGVDCEPDDDWCYGCNNLICAECADVQTQKNVSPTNEHTLEDHRP